MENKTKEQNTLGQDAAQPVVDGKKVLLRLKDVKQYFPVKKTKLREKQRYVRANDGISLDIFEGETLGLVGESGCGKSTLGRTILQLYPQSHGDILYYKDGKGIDLKKLSYEEMRVIRKDLQLIFQDPYSSLNPRMTVGQIIGEGLTSHGVFRRGDPAMKEYIFKVMEDCGLANYMFNRYPHQFSGGQRQRISLARAIAMKPSVLVLDDTTSAVDMETEKYIQHQLRNLPFPCTKVMIAQKVSSVQDADEIIILDEGKIIERGTHEELLAKRGYYYGIWALQNSIEEVDPLGS